MEPGLKKTYTISLDIGIAENARQKQALHEKPNFSGLIQKLLEKYVEETTDE